VLKSLFSHVVFNDCAFQIKPDGVQVRVALSVIDMKQSSIGSTRIFDAHMNYNTNSMIFSEELLETLSAVLRPRDIVLPP
jgi:hypothetical protein